MFIASATPQLAILPETLIQTIIGLTMSPPDFFSQVTTTLILRKLFNHHTGVRILTTDFQYRTLIAIYGLLPRNTVASAVLLISPFIDLFLKLKKKHNRLVLHRKCIQAI